MTTLESGWNYLQSFLNTANLPILLLAGSGILAVGLSMLALTKLGHSRPLWKCVILSVIAHILLIGYAWGTHLIEPIPVEEVVESEPMRINFHEDDGTAPIETSPQSNANHEIKTDWDQFSSALPQPTAIDLDQDLSVAVPIDQPDSVDRPDPLERPDLAKLPETTTDQLEVPPPTESTLAETVQAIANEAQAIVDANADDQDGSNPLLQPPATSFQSSFADVTPQPIENARQRNDHQPKQPLPDFSAFTAPQTDGDQPEIVAVDDHEFSLPERPVAVDSVAAASNLASGTATPTGNHENTPPAKLPGQTKGAKQPAFDSADQVRQSQSNFPRQNSIVRKLNVRPRRLADGQPLPQVYSLRNAQRRSEIAVQRGGSEETERAVELALSWLAKNQSKDGRWNPRMLGGGQENRVYGHDRKGAGSQSDSAITALALLAFLANGCSHLEGPYQSNVQRGLEYLCNQQARNGDLAGRAKLFARMYCHHMALLAISEAYAMTGDVRLKSAVSHGVNFTVNAQNQRDGGWRYQPGDSGDMSQFGWVVMALHSAELAGVEIPKLTKMRMVHFLDDHCMGPGKGIATYRRGQGPNTTMTAEAYICRQLLGLPIGAATRREMSDRLLAELPNARQVNMYYWYYGTMAMYFHGGESWDRWNAQVKPTLLNSQITTGLDAGSWNPNGLWAGYGGRTYATAMAALTLEVYYRYLPTYDLASRRKMIDLR